NFCFLVINVPIGPTGRSSRTSRRRSLFTKTKKLTNPAVLKRTYKLGKSFLERIAHCHPDTGYLTNKPIPISQRAIDKGEKLGFSFIKQTDRAGLHRIPYIINKSTYAVDKLTQLDYRR